MKLILMVICTLFLFFLCDSFSDRYLLTKTYILHGIPEPFGFSHEEWEIDDWKYGPVESVDFVFKLTSQEVDKFIDINFGYNGTNYFIVKSVVIEPRTHIYSYRHSFLFPVFIQRLDGYFISNLDGVTKLKVIVTTSD